MVCPLLRGNSPHVDGTARARVRTLLASPPRLRDLMSLTCGPLLLIGRVTRGSTTPQTRRPPTFGVPPTATRSTEPFHHVGKDLSTLVDVVHFLSSWRLHRFAKPVQWLPRLSAPGPKIAPSTHPVPFRVSGMPWACAFMRDAQIIVLDEPTAGWTRRPSTRCLGGSGSWPRAGRRSSLATVVHGQDGGLDPRGEPHRAGPLARR